MTAALEGVGQDRRVRVVVLAAQGPSFSAGADLNWMKAMAGYSQAENLEDARRLARLMQTLDRLPKPTVSLVHFPAYCFCFFLFSCCVISLSFYFSYFFLSLFFLCLFPFFCALFLPPFTISLFFCLLFLFFSF